MRRTTKGIIAGAAGAALLVSGATFALWSDRSDDFSGTITSGNLEINVLEPVWEDVSDDRLDFPHAIDPDTFKIIPGDTIRISLGIDAALEGENMVAALSLSGLPSLDDDDGLLAALLPGATVSALDHENNLLIDGEPLAAIVAAAGDVAYLSSADNGNNIGNLHELPATVDGVADYTLVLDIEFPEGISQDDLVQAQGTLAGLGFTLTQVRDGVDGVDTGFGTP